MTSHDLPIEEVRRLLAEDKNRHVCVFDHTYYQNKWSGLRETINALKGWRYCKCGKWEPDAQ